MFDFDARRPHSQAGIQAVLVAAVIGVLPGLLQAGKDDLDPAAPSSRLERDALLTYLGADGTTRNVKSVEDWEKRRKTILAAMARVMGPLPGSEKECPLDLKTNEEADAGSYVRRLITYQSEPRSCVPAYLCVPKSLLQNGKDSRKKAPAVLCLHPTDNKAGHKVVVGLGGKPNRNYADELARRGYVTLAPAYPLLANYQPDLEKLGYAGGTMKAIRDNMRGLDLLASLPFVDAANGFGAIGHSLGGHNAVYTAVFDTRIKVVVSSCGLDSYREYKDGDIHGWTSVRYMPRLLKYRDRLEEIPFDFPELIGALAPRYCLIIAPYGDTNFKWRSVDRVAAAAAPVYRLYGASDHLRVEHPDCGHDFPREMRHEAYAFIEAVLRGQ